MTIEVCDHGRPVIGGVWWRGIPPCEDCESAEWRLAKGVTIVGLVFIIAMIFIPLCLLLAGVFW